MSNSTYAFILSCIAGMSTIIGFLFIFIKTNKNNVISKSLGFASGVMLSVSIIDLIPNSFKLIFNSHSKINTVLLILISIFIGVLISNIIDHKVDKHSKSNLKLYKLGIITMLTIIIHNIPEGIATYITATNNTKLGLLLTIAIALHNIPEGISISMPIYYSTNDKFKSFLYTFISGIAEPLGAIISYLLLSKYINVSVLGLLYSIIAGMMINISYNELYKESINYDKKNTIIYFIIGTFIMILNHILLN